MKYFPFITMFSLLVFTGCSKGNGNIPNDHGTISAEKNKTFFDEIGAVTPLNPSSAYADALSECIYADSKDKSCTLNKLPLLGISKPIITVQDILDRTLVSHDFLGTAFSEVLNKIPQETLQMFGAVDAIVISDKINPSFYFRQSGTIYLSGRYFWKNSTERDLVTQARDEREDYGQTLQYTFDHDYILNGKSISSRAVKNIQTYDEMAINVARLLFHELSHANDFFPRSVYSKSDLDLSKTYSEISYSRYSENKLVSQMQPTHLASEKLKHIGQILFQGEKVTNEDKLVLAEDVIKEIKNDVASDSYNYSSEREDLAMNAEEALMHYFYDTTRYMVVIKFPTADFKIPDDYDYPIAWGQKNRILAPNIKPRAIYAVQNDLGESITKKISDKLDKSQPVEISPNTNWNDLYSL